MSSSPEPAASTAPVTGSRIDGDADLFESLSLFVEAVAGRPVPLAVTEVGSCWPWTASAWHEDVVPVPIELWGESGDGLGVDGEDAARSRRALRSIALHHAAAIEERGELPPIDRRALAAEHLALPAVYALLEDLRIDAAVARRYPGAVGDAPSSSTVPLLSQGMLAALAELCLSRRGDTGELPAGGRGLVDRFQLSPAVAAELIDAIGRLAEPRARGEDSLHLARQLCRHLRPDGSLAPGEVDGTGPEAEEPSEGGLPDSGAPTEAVERPGLVGGVPIDALDAPAAARASGDDDDDDSPAGGLELPRQRPRHGEARTYFYDEWDHVAGAHRRRWCRVVERRPDMATDGSHGSFIADVRSRHAALRAEIRRRLAALRADSLERVYGCLDGDELDLTAAIRAVVDRRSGAPVDDRVHVRRDRRRRDVAALFLLDLSASTSAPVIEPEPVMIDPDDDPFDLVPMWPELDDEPPPRRVIDVAKEAVALMSDALGDLGDQHAIMGFSGNGREQVDVVVAKDFAEPVGARAWMGLEAMKPLRYTRMGAAIRHGTARLRAPTASTKLLIVVSDGYPQDVDYGRDPRDREYGLQDTTKAIADALAVGIDVFCVTIDPAGHDYLRSMLPDDRYLVIDDVEALPSELARIYLTLTA